MPNAPRSNDLAADARDAAAPRQAFADADATTTPAASPANAVDSLDDVRVLMPLLAGLPNAPALAATLIEAFGSLANAVHASPARLAAFDPMVGDVAHRFEAFAALHAALLRADAATRPLRGKLLGSAAVVRRYVAARCGNRDRELVGALVVDSRMRLIRDAVVSEGTFDRTACHVREVVRLVLLNPSPGLILYHNHPSADPSPSPSDWELTDAVRSALGAVDASLFDHVVCAGASTVSLATLEPERFDPQRTKTHYTADEGTAAARAKPVPAAARHRA